jgi:UDP-N-acetylmuramoyl-L-alanyl-D-glutamate--2,6-diaminopimelate ligase
MMGEIAGRLADKVIVTDDNPRTEDARNIRAEIMAAAPGADEIGDRRRAIEQAVKTLKPGDVLLIAGKGHEDYQIVGTTKHHFSDHEVVAETLKDL